jgi:hypothetical protein
VSNWFIIAGKRDNFLLLRQLCALCEYWREKHTLVDYFIYHYFLRVLIRHDEQCAKIFNNMIYQNNQNPHYLQKELLFSEFDAEKWEKVQNVSFCHKLIWKPQPERMTYNSFFGHIEGKLRCA